MIDKATFSGNDATFHAQFSGEVGGDIDTSEATFSAQFSGGVGGGGIDTGDANAEARHIVAPYTAYVKGKKVTGTVKTAYGGISAEVTPRAAAGSQPFVALCKFVGDPTYISAATGGLIELKAPFEAFGNLQPEDVPVGKTFTSAAGFLVEGTKKD